MGRWPTGATYREKNIIGGDIIRVKEEIFLGIALGLLFVLLFFFVPTGREKQINAVVDNMTAQGVPEEVFSKVNVNYYISDEDYQYLGYVEGDQIWLKTDNHDLEGTFAHEIGHVVSEKYLRVDGLDWTKANKKGMEYLRLKGYPYMDQLDKESQTDLDWKERASEWFADDFAYFYSDNYKHRAGPQPGKNIEIFFKQLFAHP